MDAPSSRLAREVTRGLGPISPQAGRSVEMPYFTCPGCHLSYYSAASWAYSPECPRCYVPLNRPKQVGARVISISRRSKGEQRNRESGGRQT